MSIKKFIINLFKKDNTSFIVRVYRENKIFMSEWFNLTSLTKYLRANEKKIERIDIKYLITKKEVKKDDI